jgi:regulatory protein YycH of two-component signal transduction system YycFG
MQIVARMEDVANSVVQMELITLTAVLMGVAENSVAQTELITQIVARMEDVANSVVQMELLTLNAVLMGVAENSVAQTELITQIVINGINFFICEVIFLLNF